MLDKIKASIPWFLKIPAKIVFSRLPLDRRRWQRLNLFRAGFMDDPEYAFGVFRRHFQACGLDTLQGRTVLELGPGNSLLTALYARSFGAEKTWLVDTDALTLDDLSAFKKAEQMLKQLGIGCTEVSKCGSAQEALHLLKAEFLTSGLESMRSIPTESVDFIFSHAVLEHVRRAAFWDTACEMRRVLKPGGAASHAIDFRDHLQHALNNLRFSEKLWEGKLMSNSGFYTNRIPWPEMETIFQRAGFSVELASRTPWPNGLPTDQTKMADPYRNMDADKLMLMAVEVVLRPVAESGISPGHPPFRVYRDR